MDAHGDGFIEICVVFIDKNSSGYVSCVFFTEFGAVDQISSLVKTKNEKERREEVGRAISEELKEEVKA